MGQSPCCQPAQEIHGLGMPRGAIYPMWLLRIRDVVSGKVFGSNGALYSHEMLMQKDGLLKMWSPDKYCIFVSHQWLSAVDPDPQGEQIEVLRKVLEKMINGSLDVTTDIISQIIYQESGTLGPDERCKIENGYIWIDWAGIPQIKDRRASLSGVVPNMVKAVESIPAYVQATNMFLALTPPLVSKTTGNLCSYNSWLARGWCRVEFCCHGLRPNAGLIIVATSIGQVQYMTSQSWVYNMPLHGQFAVPSDAESMVKPIMMTAFDDRISHHADLLEPSNENTDHLLYYRWATATKQRFTKSKIGKSDWLPTYRYKALSDVGEDGWGPLMCAVVENNAELVEAILTAGASVNAKMTRSFPDIAVKEGMAALHFAAAMSSTEIVGTLVKAKADIDLNDGSGYYCPLFNTVFSDRPEIAELLLDNEADIEFVNVSDTTPLMGACCFGAPKVFELLLRRGAKADTLNALGCDALGQCIFYCECPPIIKLLIEHKADLAHRTYPEDAFKGLFDECVRAVAEGSTSTWHRSLAVLLGGTALHLAAFNGWLKVTEMLLEARADPSIRNDARNTPAEVAQLYGHTGICDLILDV